LIQTRARRLGVWGWCERCGGSGKNYTTDKCQLGIELWFIHPRKGCSRGVEVHNIEQGDLPKVYDFLNEAATRNANRFGKIPQPA
jgi:hypothetical protein